MLNLYCGLLLIGFLAVAVRPVGQPRLTADPIESALATLRRDGATDENRHGVRLGARTLAATKIEFSMPGCEKPLSLWAVDIFDSAPEITGYLTAGDGRTDYRAEGRRIAKIDLNRIRLIWLTERLKNVLGMRSTAPARVWMALVTPPGCVSPWAD